MGGGEFRIFLCHHHLSFTFEGRFFARYRFLAWWDFVVVVVNFSTLNISAHCLLTSRICDKSVYSVNQRSLSPMQCQQESPIWNAVMEETSFSANSSIVIWLGCGTAQVKWPWCYCSSVTALLQLGKTALLWSSITPPATGNTVFTGIWKYTSQARGELTYTERRPHSWSLIGLFSCKWRL